MLGSIRMVRVTLSSLALGVGLSLVPQTSSGAGDEPAKPAVISGERADKPPGAVNAAAPPRSSSTPSTKPAAAAPDETPGDFAQPGDDRSLPFVPLRPSTVDDRRRTEAVRLYSAARALEDQRAWSDAVTLLQEALKLDPDSIAVIRRLCRLYVGALGRPELALQYGKRILSIEPGDANTLTQLVDYYKKSDPTGAEDLLNEVLANPKLDAHAPARLLAEFELGRLYAGRLHQTDKAAEAYAKVLEALDDKSANRFSQADLSRVLRDDPSVAYLEFSLVFLAAKKYDLAVRALERGLVYDEDNSQIALLLADTLVRLNKGGQALALVERHIERQTPFIEYYELLGRVLKALNREKEFTPRVEAAAKRDSKNVPLQYFLADRYRETGDVEKAELLYKDLLSSQPTPQTYRALAASLLKRKKAADLLKVISEAWVRNESQDAVKPQLVAAALDDEIAEAMLDEGLRQSLLKNSTLPKTAFQVLSLIANYPGRSSANKQRRLEKLLRLQRLAVEQNPSDTGYIEIADTLKRLGNFAEAANAVEQLIAKYPGTKSARTLIFLADYHRRAGHFEAAKATLKEAIKLDSGDPDSQLLLVDVLRQMGQMADAIQLLRAANQKTPGDPRYGLTLADLLSKSNQKDEAIKLFEEMLKRHGDNEDLVSLIRQSLSAIYVDRGDFVKGEAQLEMLLQRNPDDPGPNNDLGYLYAEQGKNLEKAESMIRKALSEDPNSVAYLDSLGWVLFKRGKFKEALEPLMKAAAQMKADAEQKGTGQDATIFEHLGDVYFQLQQLEQARSAWRQAEQVAAQNVPPDKRLAEIRKKLDSLAKLGPIPKPTAERTP